MVKALCMMWLWQRVVWKL